MKRLFAVTIIALAAQLGYSDDDSTLEQRVTALEKEVAELKAAMADKLFEEINQMYPEAVDHSGRTLTEAMEE